MGKKPEKFMFSVRKALGTRPAITCMAGGEGTYDRESFFNRKWLTGLQYLANTVKCMLLWDGGHDFVVCCHNVAVGTE